MATNVQTAQGLGLAIFGAAAGAYLNHLESRAGDASALATELAGYYKTEMKKDLSVADVLANLKLESGTAAYTAAKTALEMQVAGGATVAVAAASLVTFMFGLTDTISPFYETATAFKARVDVAVAWSKGAGATEKSVAALAAYQAGVDNPGPVVPPVPEVITTALTTAADNLPGTVGADAFTGVRSTSSTLGTLGATDKIDGGEGTDSLTVTMTSDFTGFTTGSVKSVEVINLTNTGDVARSFDATGVVGTATYNLDGKSGVSLTNADTFGTVNVLNRASGTTTVDFADTKVSSTTDNSFTLGVTGLGAGTTHVTVTAAEIQKMTVVASGAASNVDLAGAPLKSLTISGGSDLSLRATSISTLTTIDGSEATGKLTLGRLSGTMTSVKTGSADDAVTIGAMTASAVLSGGAGNDKLTMSAFAADTYQPTMTGFENLVVANSAGAIILSMSKSTDVASLTVDTLGGNLTMVKAGAGALSISAKGAQADGPVISNDTTGAVSFATIAADTVTSVTNDANSLDVTASKAASLNIAVAKFTNVPATSTFSAGEAKSVTLDAKGAFSGVITAAKATDMTITASESVTLTSSTLTALNNLTATGAKNLTASGLTGAGTLTLAGTGSSSTLNTGALGAAASTQAIALTATGWKGGATIGAVDSQDTISLNVAGTTGTVGIGAIGALGAAASPATPAGSVTINASGALGAVTQTGNITVGAGKSITVTAKDAIAAISVSNLSVATSSSNPSGSITVDVSGGVAAPTVGTMNAATVTVDVSGLIAAPTVGVITALTATYTGEATRANTRTDTVNNLTYTGGSDVDTVTIAHQDSLATVAGVTATSANAETHALNISTGSGNDVLKFTGYVGQLTATYTGTIALGSGSSDSLTFVASAASTLLDLQALSVTGQDAAIVVTGGAAAATIYGTTGDDAITGGAAADVIFGGTGADVIAGGAGAAIVDTMTGGLGADTFTVIAQPFATVDLIKDFVGGTDKLKTGVTPTTAALTNLTATATAGADLGAATDAAIAAAIVLGATNYDTAGDAVLFKFGTKTYVVVNDGANVDFTDGTDVLVELTGITGTMVIGDIIA